MSKKKAAWIPAWAAIIASILVAFEYGKIPPSQPNMIEVLGLSYTMQGLLMTAFSIAAVVMGLIGGHLIDKFGAKKVLSIALGITIIGNIAGIFWYTDTGLLVTRVMEGVGYGVSMVSGPVLISAWYEPAKRGLAYGVFGANVGVAILICLGAANPILAVSDWKGMWIFGLIGAVLALLLAIICVCMPSDEERKDLYLDDGTIAEKEEKHSVLWGYLAPLPILGAIMFFLVGGSTDAFNNFTITYLNVELGNSYTVANMCSIVASVGLLVGAIIMGFIFAKAKDKGLVIIVNVILAIIFNFLWFNLEASIPVTYALAFLGGCVLGAAPTAFFAIPAITARSKGTIGAASAVMVLGQNLGTLTIPTVIGMILDASGYHMAAVAMGCFAIIALIIAFVWRSMYRKRYGK